MAVMTIINGSQIEELLNRVHDWWFDIDAVSLDAPTGSVTIALEPTKRELKSPSGRGLIIVIAQARKLSVCDTEKVGFYDVNEICFSEREKTIRITGGIPITIVVLVEGLEIEVINGRQQ